MRHKSRTRVSEDTQIHMTSVYTRNGRGSNKNKLRHFSFVIKGLLISTTLVSVVLTGGVTAFANGKVTQQTVLVNDSQLGVHSIYNDEAARINNLKIAVQVLEDAIQKGQITASLYKNVMQGLNDIDAMLSIADSFSNLEDFISVTDFTDKVLKRSILETDKDILSNRSKSLIALERVQNKLNRLKGNHVSIASVSSLALSESSYNDYEPNQYWSQDMLWAVENGLIQGYLNSIHPGGGTVIGNWLNPYGELKEAQMLAILLRYFKNEELVNTVPTDANFWASTAYQLAEKYNLPTQSTLANRTAAYAVTTRGVLAQNLVSLHFGKQVTMQQAVQFMYDAGLSTGLSITNGVYPMTFDSYGVNSPLKRSHIVSFMKRYDDFVKSGVQVDLQENSSDTVKEDGNYNSGTELAPQGSQVVNGITVKYGRHIYGSKNQAQYDQVMQIVETAVKNWDQPAGGSEAMIFQAYLNGERGSRVNATFRDKVLISMDKNYKDMVNAGLSKEAITKVVIAHAITASILYDVESVEDGRPESAYDALMNRIQDCDAGAQVYSAVFDAMGINTVIMKKPGHANMYFEMEGKWFIDTAQGGNSDLTGTVNSGFRVFVQPTNGDIINSDGTITRK